MREKNRANPMRSPLSIMRGGIKIQVEIPQDLTRGQKNPVLGAWVKKINTQGEMYICFNKETKDLMKINENKMLYSRQQMVRDVSG